MSTGELLPEDLIPGTSDSDESGGNHFRAMAGWAVLVLILIGIGLFGYRVWSYVKAIEEGKISGSSVFSVDFSGLGSSVISNSTASRELLEVSGRPSGGAGPDVAEAVVVIFADFQCPYCKDGAPVFRQMMSKYGDRVRFIFRHYPIDSIHPEARQAAEAAECAYEQGLFWQYHDKILLNSDRLSTDTLLRYAEQVGVEQVQFERCMTERRYKETVEADVQAAKTAGVSGTPTLFFNGQKVEGAIPSDIFESILSSLLAPKGL